LTGGGLALTDGKAKQRRIAGHRRGEYPAKRKETQHVGGARSEGEQQERQIVPP
jgi:hypothetical protein